MDLRIGPVAASCAAPTGDETLPWYNVAMTVSSLAAAVSFAPQARRSLPPLETIAILARREPEWPVANSNKDNTPKRESYSSTLGDIFLCRDANA
jgi:hypothetical protein